MAIYAGVRGHLDAIGVEHVSRFEAELLADMRDKNADVLETIRIEGAISDETEAKLKAILEGFVKTFA